MIKVVSTKGVKSAFGQRSAEVLQCSELRNTRLKQGIRLADNHMIAYCLLFQCFTSHYTMLWLTTT